MESYNIPGPRSLAELPSSPPLSQTLPIHDHRVTTQNSGLEHGDGLNYASTRSDQPRRRSSLNSCAVVDAAMQAQSEAITLKTQTNSDPTVPTRPLNTDGDLDVGVMEIDGTQAVQRVLQAARANLHLDIHFATSPAGSIDARLPVAGDWSLDATKKRQDGVEVRPERVWRYSTIPEFFRDTTSDVREPIPPSDDSLALPELISQEGNIVDARFAIEPLSSGFTSHFLKGIKNGQSIESGESGAHDIPHSFDQSSTDGPDLTQSMSRLYMENSRVWHDEQSLDSIHESPILSHLKRKSAGKYKASVSPNWPDGLFLSQSAKAAAEHAKAKRATLLETTNTPVRKENVSLCSQHPALIVHREQAAICPRSGLQPFRTGSCTRVGHRVQTSPTSALKGSPPSTQTSPRYQRSANLISPRRKQINSQLMVGSRAPTTETPTPLPRQILGPSSDESDSDSRQPLDSPLVSSKLRGHAVVRPLKLTSQHSGRQSERIQSGWYCTDALKTRYRDATHLYSFSTAATKATGKPAALDSRIQHPCRADTLIPLIHSPRRLEYDLAAVAQPHTPWYQPADVHAPKRLPHERLPTTKRRPHLSPTILNSRNDPYVSIYQHTKSSHAGKRSFDDIGNPDFDIMEDESAESPSRPMSQRAHNRAISIDDRTRSAIQISLSGPRTPECLQGEREGIRELSPNVKVWRKGTSGEPHRRKKRRPSYWDPDLEEVRLSPASRGDVANSSTAIRREMMWKPGITSGTEDLTKAVIERHRNVLDVRTDRGHEHEKVAAEGEEKMERAGSQVDKA